MPLQEGAYQEVEAYRNIVNQGRLKDLPGYAVRMLWQIVCHTNFKTGWSWIGTKRREKLLGLNYQAQIKGLYVLLRKGFFRGWGYTATQGGKVLSFQLEYKVPPKEVPSYKEILKESYDHIGRNKGSSYLRLLLGEATTTLGKSYDHIKIKKVRTLKNPKEPKDGSYLKEEGKGESIETKIDGWCKTLSKYAGVNLLTECLRNVPEKHHYRIHAFLRKRYPTDPIREINWEKAKEAVSNKKNKEPYQGKETYCTESMLTSVY